MAQLARLAAHHHVPVLQHVAAVRRLEGQHHVLLHQEHGRPVVDLTKDDFDLFEDGARQTIGSFSLVEQAGGIGIKVGRRVSASTGPSGGAAGSPAVPAVSAERPTIAIVFDALKPDALELAQKAALAYLPLSGDVDARVGVFAADPGLRVGVRPRPIHMIGRDIDEL